MSSSGRRRARHSTSIRSTLHRRAPERRPGRPLALVSALAVAGLVAVAALPAYALVGTTVVPESSTLTVSPQALSVPTSPVAAEMSRDGYQVTRTDLGNFQPYSHLADTFVNEPSWTIQWPFAQGAPISSGFGYRDCSGCSSDHQGLDFNPGEGTPIQAITDGTVIGIGGPGGSFGVVVTIEHWIDGQKVVSLYAHMLEGSVPLQVGQTVTAGTLVGQVGNTGQSTGPHLHFGIYLNGTEAVDPYSWMLAHVG